MDKNQEIFSKLNSGDFSLKNFVILQMRKVKNQKDLNKFVQNQSFTHWF